MVDDGSPDETASVAESVRTELGETTLKIFRQDNLGAGAARNRAVREATSDYLAFLDADDSWEPGYLAALLPLAGRHGVAFGRTRVLCDGRPLIVLPGTERAHLVLDDLGTGASFHPVMARALAGPFRSLPSQDVLHAAEALSAAGGTG